MSQEIKQLKKLITQRFGSSGIEDAESLLENADEMATVMGYINTESYIDDVLRANFSIDSTKEELKKYVAFLKNNSLLGNTDNE